MVMAHGIVNGVMFWQSQNLAPDDSPVGLMARFASDVRSYMGCQRKTKESIPAAPLGASLRRRVVQAWGIHYRNWVIGFFYWDVCYMGITKEKAPGTLIQSPSSLSLTPPSLLTPHPPLQCQSPSS